MMRIEGFPFAEVAYMEQTPHEATANPIQSERNKRTDHSKFFMITTAVVLLVLVLSSAGYQFQQMGALRGGVEAIQTEMELASSRITERDQSMSRMQRDLDFLRNELKGLYLSHSVENNVVTDELYISKAELAFDRSISGGVIRGRVDLDTQPGFAFNYTGTGRFRISDRELTVALRSLMDSLERYISFAGTLGQIEITINNYPLATYNGDQIFLAGEGGF